MYVLFIKGFQRWDEGRWGIGNTFQFNRVYTKDSLAHLPSSHFFEFPEFSMQGLINVERSAVEVTPAVALALALTTLDLRSISVRFMV